MPGEKNNHADVSYAGDEYSVYYCLEEFLGSAVEVMDDEFIPTSMRIQVKEIINARTMVPLERGPHWNRIAKAVRQQSEEAFFNFG